MEEKNKRARIIASGRVQGVFFRLFTEENAKKIGLCGFVRNLPDGRVEVLAEGKEGEIKKMIDFLRKGPPLARVNNLQVFWQEYKGEFNDFQIRYS